MTQQLQWVAGLLLILTPALAWSEERNPMPPPGASAHGTATHDDEIGQRQADTATPLSTEDRQAIAAEEKGSDVRAYTRQDGTKVTEYARQGRVYMIKVQPSGDLPAYYLYDEHGNGQFSRRLPGGYQHTSPPQWVIKEF